LGADTYLLGGICGRAAQREQHFQRPTSESPEEYEKQVRLRSEVPVDMKWSKSGQIAPEQGERRGLKRKRDVAFDWLLAVTDMRVGKRSVPCIPDYTRRKEQH
jgi:hypothetical protein